MMKGSPCVPAPDAKWLLALCASLFEKTSGSSDKARIELIKVDQEDHDKYLTGAEFTLYQVVDDQDPAAEEIEVNGQKLWLKVVAEKITSGTLTDAVTGAVPGGALTGLLDTGTYYLRETQPPPHDKDYFYEISQE